MYEIYARLRDEKGLNDYRVSKAVGISAASLSDWKHGKSTPKADKLQRLADYFGVSIKYLMGLQVEKAEEKQDADAPPIREYLVKTEEMELLIEEAERHSPENLKLIVEMMKKMK